MTLATACLLGLGPNGGSVSGHCRSCKVSSSLSPQIIALFNEWLISAGITGRGLGLGVPDKIPEVETDFIFSAIASELGLLGATAVLLAFLAFVYRGIKISLLAEDESSKLLAFGLTALFALQTLIIEIGRAHV